MIDVILRKVAEQKALTPAEMDELLGWFKRTEGTVSAVSQWTNPMGTQIQAGALEHRHGMQATVLERSANQAVVTGTDTELEFDTTHKQGLYEYDSTNKRFMIPEKNSGILITGAVAFASSTTGYRRFYVNIYSDDDTLLKTVGGMWQDGQGNTPDTYSIAVPVWFSLSDFSLGAKEPNYFKLMVKHTHGSNLNATGLVMLSAINSDVQ